MEECLNSKEKALLEYIRTRYKNTMEVKFKIPLNTFNEIGIIDADERGKFLMSLAIRDYISIDKTKDMHILWTLDITLTEKALNVFNKEN